nr:hypothetical protein GCM10020092_005070 [Actinoplanes digitatis]
MERRTAAPNSRLVTVVVSVPVSPTAAESSPFTRSGTKAAYPWLIRLSPSRAGEPGAGHGASVVARERQDRREAGDIASVDLHDDVVQGDGGTRASQPDERALSHPARRQPDVLEDDRRLRRCRGRG